MKTISLLVPAQRMWLTRPVTLTDVFTISSADTTVRVVLPDASRWTLMAPKGKGGGGEPSGPIGDAINKTFGSFDSFKEKFNAAVTRAKQHCLVANALSVPVHMKVEVTVWRPLQAVAV